jgi:hypothetical protein
MKEGVRILAVACAPTDKKKTLLVGLVSRMGYMEGVVSTKVTVDGTDSTDKIIELLKRSRFGEQVRVVLLNGLGVAGLNILDVRAFEKSTKTRVISLTRKRPRPNELIKALRAFSRTEKVGVSGRIRLVESFKKLNCVKAGGFFLQTTLLKGEVSKFATGSFELLRLAHIIASGVTEGESKGRI